MLARTSLRRSDRRRRYAPRKGTIRGSAGAPQATAKRSDQAPAQVIAARAAVVPRTWATSTQRLTGFISRTAQPVITALSFLELTYVLPLLTRSSNFNPDALTYRRSSSPQFFLASIIPHMALF